MVNVKHVRSFDVMHLCHISEYIELDFLLLFFFFYKKSTTENYMNKRIREFAKAGRPSMILTQPTKKKISTQSELHRN